MAYRIGLILPSSNISVEPVAFQLVRHIPDATVHISRLRVRTVEGEAASARQFAAEPMASAADLLRDAQVDVVAWAGTSGSWLGIEQERELVHHLADVAGAPATTATLALLAACRSWGVAKVGMVTPYTDEIVVAIRATFASVGIEVVREAHLGITDSFACSQVDEHALATCVREVAGYGIGAVLLVCTNFAAGNLAAALEPEIGVPVLDSTAATLWHACVLGGHWSPLDGYGMLLASTDRAVTSDGSGRTAGMTDVKQSV